MYLFKLKFVFVILFLENYSLNNLKERTRFLLKKKKLVLY